MTSQFKNRRPYHLDNAQLALSRVWLPHNWERLLSCFCMQRGPVGFTPAVTQSAKMGLLSRAPEGLFLSGGREKGYESRFRLVCTSWVAWACFPWYKFSDPPWGAEIGVQDKEAHNSKIFSTSVRMCTPSCPRVSHKILSSSIAHFANASCPTPFFKVSP